MAYTIESNSLLRQSAKLSTRLAFTAMLVLGMFAASANAAERGGTGHSASGSYHGSGGHSDVRGRGFGGWTGGHYRAPVLIYGSPYYCTPPLIYTPFPYNGCECDPDYDCD
jgi:hypothetical protein